MKLTPNKYFSIPFLVIGFNAMAKQGPPPPAAAPPPPGFPVDENLIVLMFFGVLFSFLFLKKKFNLSKKA